MKLLLLDTETTGLNNQDEIIELAMILVEIDRNGQPQTLSQYAGLREPGVPVGKKATQLTGLTLDDLRGHDLDHLEVAAMLYQAEAIIAHNAPFDRRFMRRLYPNLPPKPWYCSARGLRWQDYGFPNAKLHDLLAAHNLPLAKKTPIYHAF